MAKLFGILLWITC